MYRMRKVALPFLAAIISSAATAAILIGGGRAEVTATPGGSTITVRANEKVLIPQFRWRCMVSTNTNAAGKQVPYVFGCYPSDWDQNCNDAPVVWMFKNAATVSGAEPPTKGSGPNGFIFYKKRTC